MPSSTIVWRSSCRNRFACSAERMSGLVTISTSGVPPRLKSTFECAEPTMRPVAPPPKPASQLQNIFVRVFSWTWISRPMTGSHSGIEELLGLQQRNLDVAAHLEDRQVLLERAVHADQAELALAGFERQPDVSDLHRTGPVQQARAHSEDPLDGEDEVGRPVDY